MNDVQRMARLIDLLRVLPDARMELIAEAMDFASPGALSNFITAKFGMKYNEFKAQLL